MQNKHGKYVLEKLAISLNNTKSRRESYKKKVTTLIDQVDLLEHDICQKILKHLLQSVNCLFSSWYGFNLLVGKFK